MKLAFCLSLTITLCSLNAQVILDSTIQLDNETGKMEIPIQVTNGADKLSVSFEGRVSSGSFEVELRDPDDQRQGGFQLNSSSDDYVKVKSSKKNSQNKKSSRNEIRSSSSSGKSKSSISITTGDGKNKSKNSSKGSNSNDGEDSSISISNGAGSGQNISITSASGQHVTTVVNDSSGSQTVGIQSQNGRDAKGIMNNSISDPASGIWYIVVDTEDVTGRLEITVEQN